MGTGHERTTIQIKGVVCNGPWSARSLDFSHAHRRRRIPGPIIVCPATPEHPVVDR
ncbi:hypothetical protein F0726_02584 [Acidithiobacillus caldus]|nr:hypothetical protein F0726_02584 [Acidithiobacillus caldus]